MSKQTYKQTNLNNHQFDNTSKKKVNQEKNKRKRRKGKDNYSTRN